MMKDEKSTVDAADPAAADGTFSFGVTELRAAEQRRQGREARLARAADELALVDEIKLRSLDRGFDPYNSGSFDRRDAWQRIARRP
jgi:hypothetical protein